ncbi:MAG: sulfatase-like hydrolase/transferase, partial [Planctomycetales bacterium]|nr:sulfatase-like hydrolase/transferase [Planctomycetales bacterium]
PDRDVCIARPLKEQGYATFYCGKWHLGQGDHLPTRNGFDVAVAAGAAGATASHFAPYNETRRQGHRVEAPLTEVDIAPSGEYLTDRLTDEAIKFLEAQSTERPFFAVLAHYAVHTPIEGKKEIAARYRKKLRGQGLPEHVMEPESAGENLAVQNNPVYAAMIESVDEGVGRLLKCLNEKGMADNTVVVLASDHGGLSARGNKRPLATSNRPLRAGKGHLYEGGIRIPLIVRWPGVTTAGAEPHEPTFGADFYPTFLEIAGAPAPESQQHDGESIVPYLRGQSRAAPRVLYWHNPAPRPTSTGDWYSSAVREGDWKLIDFPDRDQVELYNLVEDLGESNNLADQNVEKAAHLKGLLDSWRTRVGAAAAKQGRRSR